METKFLNLFDDIYEMAWENYYLSEVLRCYCNNDELEILNPVLLVHLLGELTEKQKLLIDKIDMDSTSFNHELITNNLRNGSIND